ncbi:POK18 protein, partial [Oenanthe oenanthe]|nr:POK18 protein [Oenanthe oenanthe]
WNYLGMMITESRVCPQKTQLIVDIQTLNDVQKLVGDLQWIRTFCGITNEELELLHALLMGGSSPTEP